jgi:hypothetical protein
MLVHFKSLFKNLFKQSYKEPLSGLAVLVTCLVNLPLSDREQRILNYLRNSDRSGFNELFNALVGHANRSNLRTSLDKLIGMELVHATRVRSGYKDIYVHSGNLSKFKEHSLLLIVQWKIIKQQLQQFDQILKADDFNTETKVSFLTFMVCRAASITQSVFFLDEKKFPKKMKEGLIDHSLREFQNLLKETAKVVKRHRSVAEGFDRVSKKFLSNGFAKNFQRTLRKLASTEEEGRLNKVIGKKTVKVKRDVASKEQKSKMARFS